MNRREFISLFGAAAAMAVPVASFGITPIPYEPPEISGFDPNEQYAWLYEYTSRSSVHKGNHLVETSHFLHKRITAFVPREHLENVRMTLYVPHRESSLTINGNGYPIGFIGAKHIPRGRHIQDMTPKAGVSRFWFGGEDTTMRGGTFYYFWLPDTHMFGIIREPDSSQIQDGSFIWMDAYEFKNGVARKMDKSELVRYVAV